MEIIAKTVAFGNRSRRESSKLKMKMKRKACVSKAGKIRIWSQNAKPDVLLPTDFLDASTTSPQTRSHQVQIPIPPEQYPVMSKRASTIISSLVLVLWL
jgi:hypothetical protein